MVNSSKNRGQGILTTSPKVALGQQVKPSQSLAHPVKKIKKPLNKENHREHHTFDPPQWDCLWFSHSFTCKKSHSRTCSSANEGVECFPFLLECILAHTWYSSWSFPLLISWENVPEIQADTIHKSNQLKLFSVVKTKATKIKVLNNDWDFSLLFSHCLRFLLTESNWNTLDLKLSLNLFISCLKIYQFDLA